MAGAILGWLGNLLGGPFAKAAVDAYRAKLSAENTSEKIAADLATRELSTFPCACLNLCWTTHEPNLWPSSAT